MGLVPNVIQSHTWDHMLKYWSYQPNMEPVPLIFERSTWDLLPSSVPAPAQSWTELVLFPILPQPTNQQQPTNQPPPGIVSILANDGVKVSSRCLEGLWRVSRGSLEGVWLVLGLTPIRRGGGGYCPSFNIFFWVKFLWGQKNFR